MLPSHLWAAVQIVVVADIVMSLDNVIAVAAAANGSVPLLILGLAISVPLIVAGAALIMALLNALPILVWAGAGAARLDRRRRDRHRPSGSSEVAGAVRRPGRRQARRDCWRRSASAPHFANGGNGGEVVLRRARRHRRADRGSIWRRRKLQQVEQAASSAG